MRAKNSFLFILFVVSGIVLGSLVSYLCASSGALSWLSYGLDFGVSNASPMVIDLHIMKITFGFSLSINISQIIFVMLSLVIYRLTYRKF